MFKKLKTGPSWFDKGNSLFEKESPQNGDTLINEGKVGQTKHKPKLPKPTVNLQTKGATVEDKTRGGKESVTKVYTIETCNRFDALMTAH